jgi:hypothetical protein
MTLLQALKRPLAAFALLLPCLSLHAQWETQSVNLAPGWSAVYLNVDASYDTIDNLVGGDARSPIQQIWMWKPVTGTAQFVLDPSSPFTAGSQWIQWLRANVNITPNQLNALLANQAFLVQNSASTNYVWKIKGKPVAPTFQWSSAGLNFIGLPASSAATPTFDQYLSPAPNFEATAQIFRYVGGNLGATNPQQVFSFNSTPLVRGQAYWIQSPNFNNYYGPFSLTGSSRGISYGSSVGQAAFTLNNNTASALTVYLNLLSSESAPNGQPTIQGVPPILVRGAVNTTNLTYGYAVLNGYTNYAVTLQPSGKPGASVQVVLGLNRSAIADLNPGDLFAGLLRISDSTGLEQIDLPVSATVASTQGLWVGDATVTGVNQYLNTYYTANSLSVMSNILSQLNLTNGANGIQYQIDPTTSRVIGYTRTNAVYLSTSSTMTNAGVPAAFSLRLILHSGTNQSQGAGVTLLQHVYVGNDVFSNSVVTGNSAVLDPNQLGAAKRISSVQFPWQADSANLGWFTPNAVLGSAARVSLAVNLDYNDHASNPFVHTYHPDHDNLDTSFSSYLPAGKESFNIRRSINLYFAPPKNDFASLTSTAGQLTGNYYETITLSDNAAQTRNFDVQGVFAIHQIVNTPTFRTQ